MESAFTSLVVILVILPAIAAIVWLFVHKPGLVHVSELNIRIAFSLALLFSAFIASLIFSSAVIADLVRPSAEASALQPLTRFSIAASAVLFFILAPLAIWAYCSLPMLFKRKYGLSKLTDENINQRVMTCAQLLGLKIIPKLEQSQYPVAPFIYGRPGFDYSLVFPNHFARRVKAAADSAGQDEETLQNFVISHELSHAIHRDVLLTSFAAVFSRPLMWWCIASVPVAVANTIIWTGSLLWFAVIWLILGLVYLGLIPYSRHKEFLADARAAIHFLPSSQPDASNAVTPQPEWFMYLEKVFSFPLPSSATMSFVIPVQVVNNVQELGHITPRAKRLFLVIFANRPTPTERQQAVNEKRFVGTNTPLPSVSAYAYYGASSAFMFVTGSFLLLMIGSLAELLLGTAGSGQAAPLVSLAIFSVTIPLLSFMLPVAFAGRGFTSLPIKRQSADLLSRLAAFFLSFVAVTEVLAVVFSQFNRTTETNNIFSGVLILAAMTALLTSSLTFLAIVVVNWRNGRNTTSN